MKTWETWTCPACGQIIVWDPRSTRSYRSAVDAIGRHRHDHEMRSRR